MKSTVSSLTQNGPWLIPCLHNDLLDEALDAQSSVEPTDRDACFAWRFVCLFLRPVRTAPSPSLVPLAQVEGAYMQGVGWLTMEEIVWSLRDGRMLTGPHTYAIPLLADTPLDLRTALLKGKPCPENICGSKRYA